MRLIIAVYDFDDPTAGYGDQHKIPWVVTSTHKRFIPGTRFDYGFLQIALSEGYEVQIKQRDLRDANEQMLKDLWRIGEEIAPKMKR